MDIVQTPDTQGTGSVQNEYAEDLKKLRRDYGCTPERLKECKFLYKVLSSRLLHSKHQPDLNSCIVELKNIIGIIGDNEKRGALMAALGLDENHRGPNLNTRRNSYLKTFAENRRPDIRTLQRWEDKAIRILAESLLGEPLIDSRGDGGSEMLSGSPIEKPLNSLVTTRVADTFYFSNRGIVNRLEVMRWVRALDSDVEPIIVMESNYLTERGEGVQKIEPTFGCSIDSEHAMAGGIITTFRLHRQLKPSDGSYTFGYRRLIKATITSDPIVWWIPEYRETRYEVRIVFRKDMVPLRAWWFVNSSVTHGQMEPDLSEGRHLELLDSGGYVYKNFDDMRPRLAHGISWIWRN